MTHKVGAENGWNCCFLWAARLEMFSCGFIRPSRGGYYLMLGTKSTMFAFFPILFLVVLTQTFTRSVKWIYLSFIGTKCPRRRVARKSQRSNNRLLQMRVNVHRFFTLTQQFNVPCLHFMLLQQILFVNFSHCWVFFFYIGIIAKQNIETILSVIPQD